MHRSSPWPHGSDRSDLLAKQGDESLIAPAHLAIAPGGTW